MAPAPTPLFSAWLPRGTQREPYGLIAGVFGLNTRKAREGEFRPGYQPGIIPRAAEGISPTRWQAWVREHKPRAFDRPLNRKARFDEILRKGAGNYEFFGLKVRVTDEMRLGGERTFARGLVRKTFETWSPGLAAILGKGEAHAVPIFARDKVSGRSMHLGWLPETGSDELTLKAILPKLEGIPTRDARGKAAPFPIIPSGLHEAGWFFGERKAEALQLSIFGPEARETYFTRALRPAKLDLAYARKNWKALALGVGAGFGVFFGLNRLAPPRRIEGMAAGPGAKEQHHSLTDFGSPRDKFNRVTKSILATTVGRIGEAGVNIGRHRGVVAASPGPGYLGNPFKLVREEERAGVIKKFSNYFYERLWNDSTYKSQILGLSGKHLCCYCAPRPCHGHVIANFLNYYQGVAGAPRPMRPTRLQQAALKVRNAPVRIEGIRGEGMKAGAHGALTDFRSPGQPHVEERLVEGQLLPGEQPGAGAFFWKAVGLGTAGFYAYIFGRAAARIAGYRTWGSLPGRNGVLTRSWRLLKNAPKKPRRIIEKAGTFLRNAMMLGARVQNPRNPLPPDRRWRLPRHLREHGWKYWLFGWEPIAWGGTIAAGAHALARATGIEGIRQGDSQHGFDTMGAGPASKQKHQELTDFGSGRDAVRQLTRTAIGLFDNAAPAGLLDRVLEHGVRLGKGTFGAVYEGLFAGEAFAAKIPHQSMEAMKAEVRRYGMAGADGRATPLAAEMIAKTVAQAPLEAENLRRLRGVPGIPHYLGYEPQSRTIFMEKVAGVPATAELGEDRFAFALEKRTPGERRRAVREIQATILRSVRKGVMPADIHGGNILITEASRANVIDVGLWKPTRNIPFQIGWADDIAYATGLPEDEVARHVGVYGRGKGGRLKVRRSSRKAIGPGPSTGHGMPSVGDFGRFAREQFYKGKAGLTTVLRSNARGSGIRSQKRRLAHLPNSSSRPGTPRRHPNRSRGGMS